MRYYTLLLVLILAILYGCEQAEDADTSRQSPYVITSQQDGKNPYKYKFGIDNYGRELTASDAVFAWDFGDNDGIVTKSNPEHVYVENGEKKVTVSLLVDGKRVSADTVILVGEPAAVHDSVINAFPGEVSNPLYYKLVSSANSSGGVYNYKWEITGPDGENGEYVTYTYPDPDTDDVLDKNTLNHQFQKYGYGYYVNLWIKSRDAEEFAATPDNTMYFNTVLPELSMKCEKAGLESGKNVVNCKPNLAVKSGAISDNMKYEWVYYDINDDGTPVKEGSKETEGQAEVKLLLNDGRKVISLTGSNIGEMIGKVQYETEIMLSSAGTLGNLECARPVNNVGEYTDDTRLQYECKAVGYYHKQENLNEPLPLAKYIWQVAESNNSSSIYNIDWGGESDEKQYLNKDYKTYQGYGDKAKVRVDCDNRTNRCISTLLFTAPKYGKSYTISIKGTSAIDSTELTTAPSSVTIHKPQMLYIEKKASESNPMLFTLTPKFDTVIPASAKLNLKWNATGSDILDSNNKWLPAELDNKSLTNNARSYNYTFPKSGNYVIDVQVTGDVFDGTLEKAENYDGSILKLDQSVAGSYFVYSLNTFAAQVTFNTDYEIRVNGTPVPTTYVYSITGPTKANINASNTTKVDSTDKTFITAKNFGTHNNVRLLFGGTYTVELEVYQTSLYNNGNINEAAKVEGVNYKKLTLPQNQSISIPSLSIEFSRKNAKVDKTWYEDSYFGMKAGSIPVDSSLFTCVWTLDNNTPSSMKLSYILPVTAQNAQRSITTDCSKKIYAYGFGEGSGTVNLNLRIHNGPAYTTNNNTGSLLDDNRSIKYTLY